MIAQTAVLLLAGLDSLLLSLVTLAYQVRTACASAKHITPRHGAQAQAGTDVNVCGPYTQPLARPSFMCYSFSATSLPTLMPT